jgi:hypothetical protein
MRNKEFEMRSLLVLLGLLTAAPAMAEINPTLPPEGIRAEVLDSQTCRGLHTNLTNHPRNVLFNKNVINQRWYKNSKGEYISFHCHYPLEQFYPYKLTFVSIVWVAPAATLKGYYEAELAEHKAGVLERQRQVKTSGLE